jgi:type IV pilus assembly protein PilO
MAISDYRFDNLPRSVQIALFGALMAGLACAFYFYYLRNLIQEQNSIYQDISKLEAAVAQGSAIESRLKRFKQELVQLEARLSVLQSILPSEKETPTVLRNIQHMAELSNLKIKKFTPQQVIPRAFYSDWPIAIELAGGYHGLGSFFEKVSQATRIIDVGTITITGIDKPVDNGQTLNASCTATTFVFREDQPAAPEEKKKNSKEKKR